MENREIERTGGDPQSREYQTLILLDDLESLLEEMEEQGITGEGEHARLSGDIAQRMAALGVHDVQQVRDRLRILHAQVDDDDRGLTISES
jgi:hypothetical protein